MSKNGQRRSPDPEMNHQTYMVGSFDEAVRAALDDLQAKDFVRRLWAKDPALWHEDPAHQAIIRNALGWLSLSEQQIRHVSRLQAFADEVKNAGFTHILLLGMGGSSLCPEVCRLTFGVIQGYPELHVLDSTVPSQVRSFEAKVDLEYTLCIVASKSGSTTEPLVFQKYFFERMRRIRGDRAARISSRLPTRVLSWNAWPENSGFEIFFPVCPTSEDAIRLYPTLAWCRRRDGGERGGSPASGRTHAPALRFDRTRCGQSRDHVGCGLGHVSQSRS